MERSSFFNAVIDSNGIPDRSYLAEDFARYFSTFIGSGVFPNPASQCQVLAMDNNMQVRISSGYAWINGYMYQNTDYYIFKIEPADGVLNRIDRIVLRLDFLERKIKAVVKKGDYASSPVAKALQRDTDAYEIALADIYVRSGIIAIIKSNITDLRLNKDLCGIVHGTIEQVDTTAIFDQFQNWYSTTKDNYDKDMAKWTQERKKDFDIWTDDKKKEFDIWYTTNAIAFSKQFNDWYGTNTKQWEHDFNNWFDTVKNQLDGDIGTKLTAKTIELENDILVLSGLSGKKEKLNKDTFDEFEKTKGKPNGIASLDNGGFVPTDQLSNVQYMKDFYGRTVEHFNFDTPYKLFSNNIKYELFDFYNGTDLESICFKRTATTGFLNCSSNSVYLNTYNNSVSQETTVASDMPYDITNISSIDFDIETPIDANTYGNIIFGIVKKGGYLSGTTFDKFVMYERTNGTKRTKVNIDVSDLNGEYHLKLYVSNLGAGYNRSLLLYNIIFNYNITPNLMWNKNKKSLLLIDNKLAGDFYIDFKIKNNFLDWYSLNSFVDTPNGTNIRYDVYDNHNKLLKSNIKNGETFNNLADPNIVLKVTMSRDDVLTNSPIFTWLEMGMRGISSPFTWQTITSGITETDVSQIDFKNLALENYRMLKLLLVFKTNGSSTLTINFNNDGNLHYYNGSSTNAYNISTDTSLNTSSINAVEFNIINENVEEKILYGSYGSGVTPRKFINGSWRANEKINTINIKKDKILKGCIFTLMGVV